MASAAVKRRKISHPTPKDADLPSSNGVREPENDFSDEELDEEEELESGSDSADSAPADDRNGPKAKANGRRRAEKRDDTMMGEMYTGAIFKSNLFKLQCDDLLDQARPRAGPREASIDKVVRTLRKFIETIPDTEPRSVSEAEKALLKQHKTAVPFPDPRPPKDANYKLQYLKPSSITVSGSYQTKRFNRVGEELGVDLVVCMPSALFQEKDYLNYRYFYKRAYYLAQIASALLSSSAHKFDVSYSYLNGNRLHPILAIRFAKGGSEDGLAKTKSFIQIIPSCQPNQFPREKIAPHKNCVRPRGEEGHANPEKLPPTPFYNASLLADASPLVLSKLIEGASNHCDGFQDACLFGRIWLRQRGLGGSIANGGFGNFEWASTMATLLRHRSNVLSPGFSSYQLFKATLQFLANNDLRSQPFVSHNPKSFGTWTQGDCPVFIEAESGVNLLYKVRSWSYESLRQAARSSVTALGDTVFDQFESTFIQRADSSFLRYDFRLTVPQHDLLVKGSLETLEERCSRLHKTLLKGLSDRVGLITFKLPEFQVWKCDANPRSDEKARIQIGFVVHPQHAFRLVEHGPSAEEKAKADAFRKFWGNKAELRRFKDGSILESVVWEQKPGVSVFEQIVLYLLEQHFGEAVAQASHLEGDQTGKLLPGGGQDVTAPTAPFQGLLSAFTTLTNDLRSMDGLPLQIRHIQATDPQLRYSSIHPPSSTTSPATMTLEFEGSGRWPDSLQAIQYTKVAFLLKLSDLLSEHSSSYHAQVGIENRMHPIENQAYLDITTPSHHILRLRIHHDRETALLNRTLTQPPHLTTPASRDEAAFALSAYKSTFPRPAAHTQALATAATRFPALSPAIRLLKRWFASHLLLPHFAPETIELLALRVFLHPEPFGVPGTPTAAFLRTLAAIARWDWRGEPWCVDFGRANIEKNGGAGEGGMSKSEYAEVVTRLRAWRKVDPGMTRVALCVASSIETDGAAWTERGMPPVVIAGRMTALARAAVEEVKRWEREEGLMSLGTLFDSGVEDFDFVVELDAKAIARARNPHEENARFKNLAGGKAKDAMAGFEPVKWFVQDLERLYGDIMVLFWDSDGGNKIAGLWNPSAERRPWKVKIGYSTMPIEAGQDPKEGGDGKFTALINKRAILGEIARLGGDMVSKVAESAK
ncbi:Nrap protein [Eremomyces bilateralis CBS 781.70]|uniref:U3 small nucleolar RNA-associated protein 22 n=1 Tax=Eremomyces bilateralis CBS 781.70 TaxID=1392243 RepID=A0A6G1FY26_9PEZI|nr:Nrap protein [Eremomyces bilateralis CBS 781.70]KAF1810576.1 Nrap protein [Eremomyces bilateralis CBS 781.70]